MTDSLRDQLLKLGFKSPPPAPKPTKPTRDVSSSRDAPRPPEPAKPRPTGAKRGPQPQHARHTDPRPRPPRSQEEIDLARAYALRAKAEREEAEQARRDAERKAQEKRERKLKLAALLSGQGLNVAEADLPRHFEHQGKIKRVYCTEAQIAAINSGELGVVIHDGRFVIVRRELAQAVGELEPRCLLILLEPGEGEAEFDPPKVSSNAPDIGPPEPPAQ